MAARSKKPTPEEQLGAPINTSGPTPSAAPQRSAPAGPPAPSVPATSVRATLNPPSAAPAAVPTGSQGRDANGVPYGTRPTTATSTASTGTAFSADDPLGGGSQVGAQLGAPFADPQGNPRYIALRDPTAIGAPFFGIPTDTISEPQFWQNIAQMSPGQIEQVQRQMLNAGYFNDSYYRSKNAQTPLWGRLDNDTRYAVTQWLGEVDANYGKRGAYSLLDEYGTPQSYGAQVAARDPNGASSGRQPGQNPIFYKSDPASIDSLAEQIATTLVGRKATDADKATLRNLVAGWEQQNYASQVAGGRQLDTDPYATPGVTKVDVAARSEQWFRDTHGAEVGGHDVAAQGDALFKIIANGGL